MTKQYRIIPKFGIPDLLKHERIERPCIMSSLTLKEVRRAISFANVYEILEDGSEILLDEYNYHLDLFSQNHVIVQANSDNVQDIIANAKEGDMIVLDEGVYEQNITLDKPIIINGNGKAIINSKINVTSENVTITGCTFKANNTMAESEKLIEVKSTGSFSLSNNIIYIDNTKIRNGVVINTEGVVNISGNTFEDPNSSVYNWIEVGLNTGKPIANGSKFNSNVFKGISRHNQFSFFTFEDNAEIEISGNLFEYSGNAIRISNTSSANVKLIMDNNTYNATDASDDYIYAGFLFFQDYSSGNNVMDFTNMNIQISNLIGPEGKKMLKNIPGTIDQIYYVYDNQDGIITDKNQPKITLS